MTQPSNKDLDFEKSAEAKGSRYYRPELDALRFFAFLCVFIFHRMDYVEIDPVRDLWLARLGNIGPFGVPVFFLLSAFLITELLLRERERTGRIHIQAFYMRRILRIWPLYFLVFFGLAFLNHFVPGTGTDDPLAWLAFTFFTGNWYILRHGWIAGSVDPLWSISVEEQFYIVIPVLAAFAGRKAVVVVSWILLAIAFVTVVLYALDPTPGDKGEWTNSFVQFQFFSAGTLLAILLKGRLIRLSIPLRLVGFVLAFCCWFTALIRFDVKSWDPHPTPAGALIGWLLVLVGTILFFLCTLGTPARFVPELACLPRTHLLRPIPVSLADVFPGVQKGDAALRECVPRCSCARYCAGRCGNDCRNGLEHLHRSFLVSILRAAVPAPEAEVHVRRRSG